MSKSPTILGPQNAIFAYRLSTKPETFFQQHASTLLRADKIKHLKERFPRSNYKSTSDWVEAIRTEIFSVLIPAVSEFDPPESTESGEEAEALRQWKDDCQWLPPSTRRPIYSNT